MANGQGDGDVAIKGALMKGDKEVGWGEVGRGEGGTGSMPNLPASQDGNSSRREDIPLDGKAQQLCEGSAG